MYLKRPTRFFSYPGMLIRVKKKKKSIPPEMQDHGIFPAYHVSTNAEWLWDLGICYLSHQHNLYILSGSKYPSEKPGCKVPSLPSTRHSVHEWVTRWNEAGLRTDSQPVLKGLSPSDTHVYILIQDLKKIFFSWSQFQPSVSLSENRMQPCIYQLLKKINFGRKN